MGLLDIVLGLLLAYGLYKGLRNGLFVEIASIVALVAGTYGAMHFSYFASDYLSEHVSWEPRTIKLAAFGVTFLAILIAVHLLGRFLTRIADFAMLGFINTLAGGVFGLVKVGVILGALLIFFERANSSLHLVPSETIRQSVLYEPIKEIGAFVFDRVLEPDAWKENG
jgi:membrane protein required for colicin V production